VELVSFPCEIAGDSDSCRDGYLLSDFLAMQVAGY
jgi:hypothetical protein